MIVAVDESIFKRKALKMVLSWTNVNYMDANDIQKLVKLNCKGAFVKETGITDYSKVLERGIEIGNFGGTICFPIKKKSVVIDEGFNKIITDKPKNKHLILLWITV